MEPAVFRSTARRRDSRHGTAITPFSAWQGGACVWRVGVLKADGSLDDLYGVTAIKLRISSYGGTSPGAFSWVEKTVPAAYFATPATAAAVQAGAEWHAEVQLTEEETILPVEDSGARPYWWEWRAVTPAGEVPLSAGQLIVRGNSGKAGAYALSADVAGESTARQAAVTAEAAARSNADGTEAAARVAADSALASRASTLESGQTTIAGKVTTLETAVPTKASRDLTDAVSGAVNNRLIGADSVTLDKLDPALRSSIGSGLDYAQFQGNWNAATNTPTIPAAAGNNGKWYYVNVAGVATGNAAGTYAVADRIVSNGTAWQLLKAPPTVVTDGSLTNKAFAANVVGNDRVLANGRKIVKAWSTETGTENILSFDEHGRITPDPAAAVTARVDALEPKTANLGEGLLPRDWVEGTEIVPDGVWILVAGVKTHLVWARLTEDGTELIEGTTKGGVRYPAASGGGGGGGGYAPPEYVAFGRSSGGVGVSDDAGERAIIEETAPWSDIQPTGTANVFVGRSNRITGAYGLHWFNILTKTTIPAKASLIYGVSVAGQSLAAGGSGVPLLSSTALHPTNNLMFNGKLDAGTNGGTINPAEWTSLVPMIQTPQHGQSYEMPLPATMNRLQTKLYEGIGRRIVLIGENHAYGGKAYIDIKRGTAAYNNGLYGVTRGKALANEAGKAYHYLLTQLIHGEQDVVINTSAAAYAGYLLELLANETEDIQAITGQAAGHIMLIDGCHSYSTYGKTAPTVTLGQLAAALANGRIIMVGPKYIFTYVDGIHMVGQSYRRLGEYHAKAAFAKLFGGGVWNPFAPIELGQTSTTVWARMRTPLGHALRFDTTLVSDPTPGRYGFEAVGGTLSGTPIIDGDRVVITKTGTVTELRYAYTGISAQWAGPTTGARGCLRDTDPAVSDYDGTNLYNYCNTFAMAVPPAP